ncbi:MAG: DNA repair protein RecO [Planctomycetaceae bacterium]|nr:MAG: DNA repair protein RecO [Planctomycetaceae bacterium]RPI90607.1 MAG: DNA repair protein RecO [Planctomycetaceae bacterium]
MSSEKTRAVVIRLADFSESSRVVTWFSDRFGKVATIAKGAKRLKGPFEAALDLLAVCEVVILRKSSSGLDILTEAKLLQRFTPKSGQLAGLYGGYYVAELLDALCEEDDPHPALYEAAEAALSWLSAGADVLLTLSWFELFLLREVGHAPNFETCVACGQPVSDAADVGFQISAGGVFCPGCVEASEPRRLISAGTMAVLNQLTAEGETTWQRLILTARQTRELRGILTPLLIHLLGRRPRTLRYLPL